MRLLAITFVVLAAMVEDAAGAKLHVILAGDTISKDIGHDVTANIIFLESTLRRNIPSRQINVKLIKDDDLAWRFIRGTVRELPVGQDDGLLFYYCGHGYWDHRYGNFIQLKRDRNTVYFSNLLSLLAAKRARLTVLVNDSCSAEPPDTVAPFAPGKETGPPSITPQFKSLFFDSKGVVQIDSSSPGEYALCGWPDTKLPNGALSIHEGTLFTSQLVERLEDPASGDWQKLHKAVKADVEKWFVKLKAAPEVRMGTRLNAQRSQTVRTLIDGKAVRDDAP